MLSVSTEINDLRRPLLGTMQSILKHKHLSESNVKIRIVTALHLGCDYDSMALLFCMI